MISTPDFLKGVVMGLAKNVPTQKITPFIYKCLMLRNKNEAQESSNTQGVRLLEWAVWRLSHKSVDCLTYHVVTLIFIPSSRLNEAGVQRRECGLLEPTRNIGGTVPDGLLLIPQHLGLGVFLVDVVIAVGNQFRHIEPELLLLRNRSGPSRELLACNPQLPRESY